MSNVLQLISVLGALAILGAYAASQFGLVDTSTLSYQVANFLGSAVHTSSEGVLNGWPDRPTQWMV